MYLKFQFLLIQIKIEIIIFYRIIVISNKQMTTFTIYTTGIADTDTPNNYILLRLWINKICTNITNCIPSNFTQIIIHHHDIIDNDSLNKEHIFFLINQIINETIGLDDRIIIHDFSYKPLNMLELNYPHLIIDMAHIFCYGLNKSVMWCDYFEHSNIRIEMMPINSIYFGWNNDTFPLEKAIYISPSGHVSTFIHCLENSGFINQILYDPVECLNKIIQQIKINLMSIWREIKGKVLSSEDGGHFDEMFNSFQIMIQILDKLFENKTKEEIFDFSTYTNYLEFNHKLYDSTFI